MASALVGRSEELQTLLEVVGAAPLRGAALLLLGESGIGKSALLAAAERSAAAKGFRLLKAVGVESEAQLPFAGLQQLLTPVLREVDELRPLYRDALLTALGRAEATIPEQHLIALAVRDVLVTVTRQRPTVVIGDDVQWFDVQTQDVLTFVARRGPADGVVLLSAMRVGHANPFAEAGVTEIELGGVDDAAARQLLSTTGLPPAAQRRIVEIADGNPLALLELPSAWPSGSSTMPDLATVTLPGRLERAFGMRTAALSPATRDALLVAAVDSSEDRPELERAAAALSGRPADTTVFTAAVEANLVLLDERLVRFRHPLVRSSILAHETVARRHAAHAALAETLEGQPYRSTWHLAQSIVGPNDAIADDLEENVDLALQRGAVMSAIRTLERAAQLTSGSGRRGHRMLMAAQHAYALGRVDLVDELVRAAAKTDLSDTDRARMQWLREIFDEVPGDATRVFELCDAADHAAGDGDVNLAMNLLLGAALRCWWADTGPEARARVVDVTRRRDDCRRDPRYVAALAVAEPILQGAAVSRLLDELVGDDLEDADALRLLGMAAHAIGDEVRAADLLSLSEGVLRDQGRFGVLSQVLSMETQILLELGEWDRAAAAADEGTRLAAETGQPIWSTGTLVCEARAAALQGRFEEALRLAEQAERTAIPRRLNDLLAVAQLVRGTAFLSIGEFDDAYGALARMHDPDDPSFHQRERFTGIMPYAEAALRSGHRAEARQVVAGLERVASETPSPLLHLQLLYARAVLADDADAGALFRAARETDLDRWPWIKAKIELAYGGWLRACGRDAESAAVMRSAEIRLASIGAGVWWDLEAGRPSSRSV